MPDVFSDEPAIEPAKGVVGVPDDAVAVVVLDLDQAVPGVVGVPAFCVVAKIPGVVVGEVCRTRVVRDVVGVDVDNERFDRIVRVYVMVLLEQGRVVAVEAGNRGVSKRSTSRCLKRTDQRASTWFRMSDVLSMN